MSKVYSPYSPHTSARHNENRKLYRRILDKEHSYRRILELNLKKNLKIKKN